MSKKGWDTDWLIFSRRARRGALVFLFLFIIISIAPSLYMNYIHDPKLDIKVTRSGVKTNGSEKKSKLPKFRAPEKMFNPNLYSLEDWMMIGLSEKQSQSILNYLSKGGEIKFKEDLQKLYVIDEELYELLESKIDLPVRSSINQVDDALIAQNSSKEVDGKKEEFSGQVKINSASKNELMQINGIGDYYAEQIIKLREKYGGLHSLEQLKGLYKMTDGKLDTLSEFLILDKENINQLNVNTTSKEELLNHPLINTDIANSIVFIRQRYGKYKSLDGLLQSPYIDSEKLEELSPYLSVK